MNKKTFLIASSVSACALVAGAIGIGAGTNFARVTAEMLAHDGVASGAYQLVLDKNATKIDETTYSVASKDGNAITFKTTAALGASETGLGTLAVGESIYNETPIGSIVGGWITDNLNNKDKSYSFEFGYNFGTEKAPVVKYVSNAESNGVIASNNLKDYRPSYVKFTAKEEVDLTNLVLNYHCDETRHNVPEDLTRTVVLHREAGDVEVPLHTTEDIVVKGIQYHVNIELTAGETISFEATDGKSSILGFKKDNNTAFGKGHLVDLPENKILVRDTLTYDFYIKFVGDTGSWAASNSDKVHLHKAYYLWPNDNWKKDGVKFGAYFYKEFEGGKNEAWSLGEQIGAENNWKIVTPEGDFDKIIFVRLNPDTTVDTIDWNMKFNESKSESLLNPSLGNHYYIHDDAWDKGDGHFDLYIPVGGIAEL